MPAVHFSFHRSPFDIAGPEYASAAKQEQTAMLQ
jgi:hypothetical protein